MDVPAPAPLPATAAEIASRLCIACGMCCDGTLFQIVRMQPGDAPAALGRLGMKIRSRDGAFFMEQPCPALLASGCTIYEQRPTRCRHFQCQQIDRIEAGLITEEQAQATITQARRQVAEVRRLIEESGLREDGQALSDRYERVISTPVNAVLEPDMLAVREELVAAMHTLSHGLQRDFRQPLPPQRELRNHSSF